MEAKQITIRNISDQDIIRPFRNFAGKGGPRNQEGNRNFTLALDDDIAKQLIEEGWNVKPPRPSEDSRFESERKHTLNVTIKYANFPPRVYIVTPNDPASENVPIDEESLYMLDRAEFEKVDMILNPRKWKDDFGKTGIKAYLRVAKFHLVVDEF